MVSATVFAPGREPPADRTASSAPRAKSVPFALSKGRDTMPSDSRRLSILTVREIDDLYV